MPGINDYSENLHEESKRKFQQNFNQYGMFKNLFPAIVVSENDPLEQGRIQARIVNVDRDGNTIGGKDRNISDADLPYAVSLISGFIHSRPLPGEMVILLLENPSDISSTRYWIGPIITSQLKLKFQSFQEAYRVFYDSDFNQNIKLKSRIEPSLNLPESGDVAIQGRNDTHVILKPREVFIASGLFKKGTLQANLESPCHLRMRQIENNQEDARLKNVSITELVSTVVNIYSPIGKFRSEELSQFEDNEDLKELGELAKKLHPAVFGDELIRLLDLIVKVLLNHIHTPQKPLATTPDSRSLSRYTVDGELQNIISKHIRIN